MFMIFSYTKMIKALIFDLNKVLVTFENIDKEYQKTFGISQAEFWKPAEEFMNDYTLGRMNLNQFLLNIMKKNEIDKSKLLEAKMLHEKNIVQLKGMKKFLESLRNNYSLILAAGDGKESLDLKLKKFKGELYFNRVYCTCDIGLIKTNPNYYREILKDSDLKPQESLFIDDQKSHLDAAKKLGINTILFENLPKLKRDLKIRFGIKV